MTDPNPHPPVAPAGLAGARNVGDLLDEPPLDLPAVRRRALMLSAARGHEFNQAGSVQVVSEVFPGWTRCGIRTSAGGPEPFNGWTFVYRNATTWVGFTVARSRATRDPNLSESWEHLPGARKIGFVLAALHTGIGKPVVADNAVTFLDAVYARYEATPRGEYVGHLYDMMTTVLSADLDDPDGQVAAARMLAGLGAYANLSFPEKDR